MRIEIAEGDGPIIKDDNYRKMMRRLKKIARKGAELEVDALEVLEKLERGDAPTQTLPKTARDEESRQKTPLKRTRSTHSDDDEFSLDGGEAGCESGDDDDDEEDDDDPTKILPSFIKEAMEETEKTQTTQPRTLSPLPLQELSSENKSTPETAEALDDAYYARVEAIFEKNKLPGMIEALPLIWIQNMVVTVFTDMFINIKFLLPHLQRYGVYQNTRRFIAMTQRTRDPRSSTLLFRNGKFVNTGSHTAKDARMSIQSLIDKIASVETESVPGVFVRPYANMKIVKSKVHNIVGSTTTPFQIDLQVLARYKFVTYYRKIFVGAIVEVYGISQHENDLRVKALVFETGNIVFTGLKTTEHLLAIFKLLYPFVARSAVQSNISAEKRTTKSRRRRVDADKRKATALPAGSERVIQVDADYLVSEFKAVNDGRETGQQLIERERSLQAGSVAALSTTSMNMVAFESMKPKAPPSRVLQVSASDAPLQIGNGIAPKRRIVQSTKKLSAAEARDLATN